MTTHAKPLPGCTVRPQWPTPPPHAPRPTAAPLLTLAVQVLDTPEAIREAQQLAGQLTLEITHEEQ